MHSIYYGYPSLDDPLHNLRFQKWLDSLPAPRDNEPKPPPPTPTQRLKELLDKLQRDEAMLLHIRTFIQDDEIHLARAAAFLRWMQDCATTIQKSIGPLNTNQEKDLAEKIQALFIRLKSKLNLPQLDTTDEIAAATGFSPARFKLIDKLTLKAKQASESPLSDAFENFMSKARKVNDDTYGVSHELFESKVFTDLWCTELLLEGKMPPKDYLKSIKPIYPNASSYTPTEKAFYAAMIGLLIATLIYFTIVACVSLFGGPLAPAIHMLLRDPAAVLALALPGLYAFSALIVILINSFDEPRHDGLSKEGKILAKEIEKTNPTVSKGFFSRTKPVDEGTQMSEFHASDFKA